MNVDIKIPYTTRPTMTKNLGPLITPITSQVLENKKKEIELFGSELYGHTYEFVQNNLLDKACQLLTLSSKNTILELAYCINEDVAFLFNGKLVGLCFCFPSSWIPSSKLGLTLKEIHGPVADNKHLVEASSKLTDTMCRVDLGSFQRQVWTITANPGLSAHPSYKFNQATRLEDLFFRLETQTTSPLIDKLASLFFVKVETHPVIDIWDELGSTIKLSINSMSDEVLVYKNLVEIKKLINSI